MGLDENVDHRAVGASSTGATIAGAFKTQGWPRLMTAVAVYAWNKAATPVINDDGVRRASSGNASVSCFDRAKRGEGSLERPVVFDRISHDPYGKRTHEERNDFADGGRCVRRHPGGQRVCER